MSSKKFKFVSPGVFVKEIDNSQLPDEPIGIGPVVIGRLEHGPAMRPVQVRSFSEFVDLFGNPIPGGQGGDIWRDGNKTSPTYAAYAAQAWLRNNSPITVVRLLGEEHANATAGYAGWATDTQPSPDTDGYADNNGGAYGLFMIDSGGYNTNLTGTFAAVWYLNNGAVMLAGPSGGAGQATGHSDTISGTACMVRSVGANREFEAVILDRTGSTTSEAYRTRFNFDEDSEKYVRKVFNTNPTLTNVATTHADYQKNYWLGETFERAVKTYVTGTTSGQQYGVILALASGSAAATAGAGGTGGNNQRGEAVPCQSGWVVTQDLSTNNTAYQRETLQKLFKFHGLDDGEWIQNNLKISITDIKISNSKAYPYGSFTVLFRKIDDSDNAVRIVEMYSNCNLDPNSSNYIARQVGDMYVVWDDEEGRYRHYGNHPNQSKFIRLEVNPEVDAGTTDPAYLPFGAYGPLRFSGFTLQSGSAFATNFGTISGTTDEMAEYDLFVLGGNNDVSLTASYLQNNTLNGAAVHDVRHFLMHAPRHEAHPAGGFTGSFRFPAHPLRASASVGNLVSPKDAYWGADFSKYGNNVTRFEESCKDIVRTMPKLITGDNGDYFTATTGAYGYSGRTTGNAKTEHSWIFSLDEVAYITSGNINTAYYQEGTRVAGTSYTANGGSYQVVLDQGFDKFTIPLWGGYDGLDITEKEPFRDGATADGTDSTNYSFYTIKRAIDSVADPEVVDMNLLSVPGVRNTALTDHVIHVCEERGDALGVVDIQGGYQPNYENANSEQSRMVSAHVLDVTTKIRARNLNTSYACCYWPWVQIRDSENGTSFWAPPSVVALGAMSFSEANSELWFAPAGFNRGGLTAGGAGIDVTGVRQRLTSEDRDKLYEHNINPIASFPSEGLVIFGQKTLQVQRSALDRINVRRLLIFVKKEISKMANDILFDQNVKATWSRFINQAEPFLASVKARLGLADFKVVLDETTTTNDLIDRNILYAKVFLKPLRSIEFIAIDFTITNSGASFED